MFQFRFGVVIASVSVIFLDVSVSFTARKFPSSKQKRDECVVPGGGFGTCKPLAKCEPLVDLLIKAKSRPQPCVVDLLRRSHCGFDGKEPVVCCPVAVRSKGPRANDKRPPRKQPFNKFFIETCGYVQTLDKVIGGSTAMLHEFPWMALVGYKTRLGIEYRCGGTLISSRYVLTAAHCVTALKGIHPVSVRLGEHDLDSNEDSNSLADDIPIEDLVPHPDYDKRRFQNDIALIRLAKTVEFVDDIRPICLPLKGKFTELLHNEKGVVAGWGAAEIGTSTKVLRKVSLPFIPLSECAKIYKNKVPITENQICAGGEDRKDSCSGDSGGPLQVLGVNPSGQPAYIQHGVISFGPKICGMRGMPGVLTRVERYIDWIIENVKE